MQSAPTVYCSNTLLMPTWFVHSPKNVQTVHTVFKQKHKAGFVCNLMNKKGFPFMSLAPKTHSENLTAESRETGSKYFKDTKILYDIAELQF